MTKETIRVAAGILFDDEGRLLLTDRAHATEMREYWEFPGGKLRTGEPSAEALQRELAEELGVVAGELELLRTIEHDYPAMRVAIDFYRVTAWEGTPRGLEGQALCWLKPAEIGDGMLLPADAPLLDELRRIDGA